MTEAEIEICRENFPISSITSLKTAIDDYLNTVLR